MEVMKRVENVLENVEGVISGCRCMGLSRYIRGM